MTDLKFGRRLPHPEATHPRLRLTPYLTPLPAAPAVVDYVSDVHDWPMYLNDNIGDCTIAAPGHMIEAWTAKASGIATTISDNDVLAAYEAVAGYRPGKPATDNGANMQDVCGYWRKNGIGGHKIAAFAQVDHTNLDEVKQALYMFGHVYVGVNLPAAAMDQFHAGQTWDVVGDDGGFVGGHAINLGYASTTGLSFITWGAVQDATPAWWHKYVEEAWCVLSTDWVNAAGMSPEGLNLTALGEAFAQLTGEANPFPGPVVVPPAPTPDPVPVSVDRDAALIAALDPWAKLRHIGVNRDAVLAYRAWRTARS